MHARLDLWSLPDSRLTDPLTDQVEKAFYGRCPPESRPNFLSQDGRSSSTAPTVELVEKELSQSPKRRQTEETKEDVETTAHVSSDEPPTGTDHEKSKGNGIQYDSSLVKALHSVFWVQFWTAGILKLVAGM